MRLVPGDGFLAAKLLNLGAALVAGAAAFVAFAAWFGGAIALAAVAAMLVTPAFVQAAIEPGTDLPALALALGSIACLVAGGRRRSSGEPDIGATGAAPGPPRTLAAGLLAGAAILTRPNYGFLPIAAAFVVLSGAGRWRRLAAYGGGLAAPLAAWALAARGHAAASLGTTNALNVAYEFYGGSLRRTFWTLGERRFHSLLDVARFDPPRFAGHLLRNLATRWVSDVRYLVPPWLGIPAVLGIALGAWRGRAGPAVAAHFLLGYATLTAVFYLPRFGLFLVPFYAAAAAWLVIEAAPRWAAAAARASAARPVRIAVWVALLVPTLVVAALAEHGRLALAPVETREAGAVLRELGGSGAVMADKPHAAWFAERPYVPLGGVNGYAELLDVARRTGATYLLYSPAEVDAAPQFLALLDPATSLPGLAPVTHWSGEGPHYFALYRFTGAPVATVALDSAAVRAARGYVERNPDDPLAITMLADQLVQVRRPREALAALGAARELPGDPAPRQRMAALAWLELGRPDSARAAIEPVLDSPSATGWDFDLLGRIERPVTDAHAAAAAPSRRPVHS